MRPMIEYIKNNFKGPLIGVEIGVAAGDNAMSMVKELHLKELHLVDIWEKYYVNGHFEERYFDLHDKVVKKFSHLDYVQIHLMASVDAAQLFKDNYFDFAYIDANHSYDFVKADIHAWLPKIKPGGILGGHDYSSGWKSVVKAVDEAKSELTINQLKFEYIDKRPDWLFVLAS